MQSLKWLLIIVFICFSQLLKANFDVADDSSQIKNPIDISSLGKFCFPINGKLISHYGKRGSIQHTGSDIKLQKGDSVRAAFSGVVTKAERYYGYGLLVIIGHSEGFETYYAHLNKCIAHTGDSVQAGQVVGLGGRTGRATTTHLHFELRKDRKPYNPEKFFDFDKLLVLSKTYSENMLVEQPAKEVEKEKTEVAQLTEFHIIKKGDTLYSLARRYKTSVNKLRELNNLSEKSKLSIGEKLMIRK